MIEDPFQRYIVCGLDCLRERLSLAKSSEPRELRQANLQSADQLREMPRFCLITSPQYVYHACSFGYDCACRAQFEPKPMHDHLSISLLIDSPLTTLPFREPPLPALGLGPQATSSLRSFRVTIIVLYASSVLATGMHRSSHVPLQLRRVARSSLVDPCRLSGKSRAFRSHLPPLETI